MPISTRSAASRRHLRTALAATATAALGIALAGCSAGSSADDGTVTIAQTIPTLNDPWYVAFSEGSKDMAKKLGVDFKQVTNPPSSPYDPASQISAIENLIASQPDVIQIDPTSTDGINGAIKEARQNNVKVVTDGIHVTTPVDASVVADNLQGGKLAGAYMAKLLPDGGNVAVLDGQPGRDIVKQRQDGFHAGLKDNPKAKVVAEQVADQSREGGQTVMENMLQAHSGIDAVWSAADTMSIGALEAIKTSGRSGKVVVGGFNGDPEAYQDIKKGTMAFTIDQVPYQMGATAIAMSYLEAKGETLPKKDVVLDTKLVDKSNVDDYLANEKTARAKTIASVLKDYGLESK